MPQKTKAATATTEAQQAETASIVEKETVRYQSKGFGSVLAVLQIVLFYLYWPTLCEWLWVRVLAYKEEH